MDFDLLLQNIGLLATPEGSEAHKGILQKQIAFTSDAMIGVRDEKIAYAGPALPGATAVESVDCGGRLVTPGLVDAHTHLVFGGWRQRELSLKLQGISYLDILKAGGGILSTVEATRKASEDELLLKSEQALQQMFLHGTTFCEAKSGYGLDLENELKQLKCVKQLACQSPVDLVPTFLGAHAIPKEYKDNRTGYLALLCQTILPYIARKGLAEYCDVFCETGVFTASESKYILQTASGLGLKCKAHVDEIDPIGGAEMAAETGCISAEHLIASTDRGLAALAQKNVIAVLLPATSFYLDKPYARARDMLNMGLAVAVASDFNPGSSPNLNLQFPMNLACLKYRLTPAEALCAVTLNAAAAIGRAHLIGSIETEKFADLVIWDAPDLDFIFYRYGNNLVNTVVKAGRVYPAAGRLQINVR